MSITLLSEGFYAIARSEDEGIPPQEASLIDLSSTDEGDFVGTTELTAISFGNGKAFFGGFNVEAYYDTTLGITNDLTSTDVNDWLSGKTILSTAYDSNHNGFFFITDDQIVGYYNISSNTTENLTTPIGGVSVSRIVFLPNDDALFIVGASSISELAIYSFTRSNNSLNDVTTYNSDIEFIRDDGRTIADMSYDSSTNTAYLVSEDNSFVQLNLATFESQYLESSFSGVTTHQGTAYLFRYNSGFENVIHEIYEYNSATNTTNLIISQDNYALDSPSVNNNHRDLAFAGNKLFFTDISELGKEYGRTGYWDFDNAYSQTLIDDGDSSALVDGTNSFAVASDTEIFMVGDNGWIGKYTPLIENTKFDFFNVLLSIALLIIGGTILIYFARSVTGGAK